MEQNGRTRKMLGTAYDRTTVALSVHCEHRWKGKLKIAQGIFLGAWKDTTMTFQRQESAT